MTSSSRERIEESNSEKENQNGIEPKGSLGVTGVTVGAMKPLSIRLKSLSKAQIHQSANNIDFGDTDGDDATVQTTQTQTVRTPARRKTIVAPATTTPTTNKEKKTAPRRKSIQPTVHKDPPLPKCQWDGDKEIESNLRLSRVRRDFYEKTGHRMMCTYLSSITKNKND